ncbi:MAG: RagB/SusD family nutrient uptake outer membrane protein [Mucilaginibacter sp.]|uniref:RagB/SusD family nutrient uptake outer membrane protein n=1 Tax=Mucilaginibacter sp. TaxID=1882438 RepID=UPI0031A4B4C9
MKAIKSIILAIVCISAVSCNDKSLDVTPTDQLTDATVFTSAANATLFLNDIYNSLNPGPWSSVFTLQPTEVSNDPLDNYSDNSISGPIAGIPSYQAFTNDSYGPTVPIFDKQWANMYANIRKCNLFITKTTTATFDDASKKSLIAQARFLRAYYFKSLMDLYGGVPLVLKVLDQATDGDAIFYPRNTYDECVTFIETECEAIQADLPLTVTGNNIGRATKGAALALEGEEQLYAGKWANAAATNLKIMNLGAGYDLFSDYAGTFYSANDDNKEVIFDIQYAPIIKGHARDTYWGPPVVTDGTGYGAVNPTQDLVDTYEFLDGKTEAEGSALFDPNNPYTNRDKRFAASILYDGCTWRNGIISTKSGGSAGGRTGYSLRKILDPTVVPGSANIGQLTGGSNAIIWRYAEVLLNYAEAKNEASGPDQSIYDAINKIRARGGLPNLPTGLSQDGMRQRIRRERRIELAFEGKRLFDLWRWKIAEQVFSQPLRGMKITPSGNTLTYQKVAIASAKITFNPAKNYRMPIPQTVIAQNSKITQNPGY